MEPAEEGSVARHADQVNGAAAFQTTTSPTLPYPNLTPKHVYMGVAAGGARCGAGGGGRDVAALGAGGAAALDALSGLHPRPRHAVFRRHPGCRCVFHLLCCTDLCPLLLSRYWALLQASHFHKRTFYAGTGVFPTSNLNFCMKSLFCHCLLQVWMRLMVALASMCSGPLRCRVRPSTLLSR